MKKGEEAMAGTPQKKRFSLSFTSSSRSRTLSTSSSTSFNETSRNLIIESGIKEEPQQYAIPQQYAQEIDTSIDTMISLMNNLSNWDFHSERNGVKAYTKMDGKLTSVMGVGTIPFAQSAVLEYLFDASRKREYDSTCATCTRVRTFDQHTVIDYFASKSVMMVSGRDFVNLVHWRVLDDGTIVMVAKSTLDLKCPPISHLVRGEIHVAGWKITRGIESNTTNVSFMIKMDLKGSIPSYIQSKATLDQAFSILDVTKAMQKQRKPHPVYQVVNLGNNMEKKDVNSTESTLQEEVSTFVPLETKPVESPSSYPVWSSPLYSFFCFLLVLYVLPMFGIDAHVHDILVWNSILCMVYVLFLASHPSI